MKREDALLILSEHRSEIAGFGVSSIAIFGSVARGEASPGSDIDVLVEFDPAARVGMFKFMELQEYLEHILGGRVDLVTKDALRHQLRDSILKESVGAA